MIAWILVAWLYLSGLLGALAVADVRSKKMTRDDWQLVAVVAAWPAVTTLFAALYVWHLASDLIRKRKVAT